MDGRPAAVAGETEDMPTDSGVLAPAQAQGVDMARRITAGEDLVLGHNIHGCGAACACRVEVGRGVAAAVVAVCVTARGVVEGAAIAAAVEEANEPAPGYAGCGASCCGDETQKTLSRPRTRPSRRPIVNVQARNEAPVYNRQHPCHKRMYASVKL